MSQTIRVRDEDAELIETVCSITGLNKPEAAHFLFRKPVTGNEDQLRYYAERALERYLVQFHPQVQDREDITDALRSEASLNNAEELLSVSVQGPGDPEDVAPSQ